MQCLAMMKLGLARFKPAYHGISIIYVSDSLTLKQDVVLIIICIMIPATVNVAPRNHQHTAVFRRSRGKSKPHRNLIDGSAPNRLGPGAN